jgi:hypothetical protein
LREGGARVPRVFVSAVSGEGLDALRATIARAVAGPLDDEVVGEPEAHAVEGTTTAQSRA